MEDRLIELETRLAFQDHTLQELNAVVVRQQREIDALTRELETLKAQLKTLAPDFMVLDILLVVTLLADVIVRYSQYLRDDQWSGGFLEWVVRRPRRKEPAAIQPAPTAH